MILNVVQGTPLITWLMWKNLHMPIKLLGFSPHGDGRFVNRTSRRSGKLMAWRSSYEVRSWHPTPVACRAGWFHPWPPGYTAASGPAPQALGMCVRCVSDVWQFRQESEFWEAPQVDDLFVSFVGLEVLVSNLEFHRFHLVQSHQTWAS